MVERYYWTPSDATDDKEAFHIKDSKDDAKVATVYINGGSNTRAKLIAKSVCYSLNAGTIES